MSDWPQFGFPRLGSDQTIRVIQPGQQRIKIFVDFWNVVINARKQVDCFDLDLHWDKLTEFILGETYPRYGDETPRQISGCYIFGSFSKSNSREYAYINKILDQYGALPGLFFDFKERVRKETANKCSHCGESVSRSSELGIDVLLTVEMIKHALMREHEVLALVSSDRDYLPLLSYLKDQGQRVLHVATGDAHRDMRSITWKQTRLERAYTDVCSISHDDRLVLFSSFRPDLVQEATSNLEKHGLPFKLIDISDADAIKDKDLEFILGNQHIFFRRHGDTRGISYSASKIAKTLNELREALRKGEITTKLPYVMRNGHMEACVDDNGRWTRSGSSESQDIWENIGKK